MISPINLFSGFGFLRHDQKAFLRPSLVWVQKPAKKRLEWSNERRQNEQNICSHFRRAHKSLGAKLSVEMAPEEANWVTHLAPMSNSILSETRNEETRREN